MLGLLPAPLTRRRSGSMRAGFGPAALRDRTLHARMQRAGFRHCVIALPGGGRIGAWVGGSGPALLLLGGFGADALWQWHAVAPSLSRQHRMIVPDLLWFGHSHGGAWQPTLESQVEAMTALLDAFVPAGRRIDVAGISYGGMVAWAMAALHPQRVDRLVLMGTPGDVFERDDLDALCARFAVDHPGELLLPRDIDGMRTLLRVGYHQPPSVPGFILRDVHRLHYSTYIAEKRALIDDLLRRLAATVPSIDPSRHEALLLWGRHDAIFPLEIGQRLQARIGVGARLSIIENAAHAPPLERPREVVAAMQRFLSP
mgnify:CR=1 FL=1|jgi:pimeloyl-ACP methyl ester carboxylesterase